MGKRDIKVIVFTKIKTGGWAWHIEMMSHKCVSRDSARQIAINFLKDGFIGENPKNIFLCVILAI